MTTIVPAQTTDQGLRLTVLRSTLGDCTLGGVTSAATNLTLVGWVAPEFGPHIVRLERTSRPFAPSEDAPAVALMIRKAMLGPQAGDGIAHLVPVEATESGHWAARSRAMAGGNYATGDSRVSELVSRLTGHRFYGALAVHDRFEG